MNNLPTLVWCAGVAALDGASNSNDFVVDVRHCLVHGFVHEDGHQTDSMKTFISLLLPLFAWCSAPAASLEERVENTDGIAVVSVSNVITSVMTNAAGVRVTLYSADAAIERTLRGTLPVRFRLQGETKTVHFSTGPYSEELLSRRFLVFLKRSGAFYTPSDADGLCMIIGPGQPKDDRVLWPECTSLEEAETAIRRSARP
ncbi:MAG TPA: hypothetical protein VEH04_06035 [Verrucomicrobiae bacterium]|nr:hypothetical protein [Verrucomicrobiae bacterium]